MQPVRGVRALGEGVLNSSMEGAGSVKEGPNGEGAKGYPSEVTKRVGSQKVGRIRLNASTAANRVTLKRTAGRFRAKGVEEKLLTRLKELTAFGKSVRLIGLEHKIVIVLSQTVTQSRSQRESLNRLTWIAMES